MLENSETDYNLACGQRGTNHKLICGLCLPQPTLTAAKLSCRLAASAAPPAAKLSSRRVDGQQQDSGNVLLSVPPEGLAMLCLVSHQKYIDGRARGGIT